MPIAVTFLREKGQQLNQAVQVANLLADFIRQARVRLEFAMYDFGLKDPALNGPVREALRERAGAGVAIRIAYYQKKEDFHPHALGASTVPSGTEAGLKALIEGTSVVLRPIHGNDPHDPRKDHLMHNKYIVRDAHTDEAAVWTGSTNFTDEAWKLMENNIVQIDSPTLASYYVNDFEDLWTAGEVFSTGAFDVGHVDVDGVALDVAFTPGRSRSIDTLIEEQIRSARKRIKVCAAQLSTTGILAALAEALEKSQVPEFAGIFDGPQVEETLRNLSEHESAAQQMALIKQVTGRLVAKPSRPYRPDGQNDIMHNKVIVCDDTVITGSYNFSRNGGMNAENVLAIHSRDWADRYSAYIDELIKACQA